MRTADPPPVTRESPAPPAGVGEHADAPVPEHTPERPRRTFGRRLCGLLAVAAAATVLVGLLVRWTVRDSPSVTAPLFYALSVPVLVLLTGAAAFLWLLRRGLRLTWKRCLALAGLAVLALLNVAVLGWPDATVDPVRPRVLLWNMATAGEDPARSLAAPFGVIDGYNADVVVLVESAPSHDGGESFYREAFPDHFVVRPGWGLTVLTRGQLGGTEFVELGPGAHAAVVKTRLRGVPIAVIAVDLPSDPFRDRSAPLAKLAELAAASSAERPTLVAGDFNTPADSVWFAPLRKTFRHTFETAGSGYAATWPVPAPVLHVDHVWVDDRFDLGEVWHGWSVRSDHRPVLVPALPLKGD